MLPSNFKVLAEYFIVPLLVLIISYAISGQFSLKYSAATDFFVFFFSADIGALMEYEDLRQRVNPAFRDEYLPVFGVLLTLSVLFVIFSGLTQRKIEAWREQEQRHASWRYLRHSSPVSALKYPLVRVIVCWLAAATVMPAHLFVFFGKG